MAESQHRRGLEVGKGNLLAQSLVLSRTVSISRPGDSTTSLGSLCQSSRHTMNLGSFTVQKMRSLMVIPQPAGQSHGGHLESSPGWGGPFPEAISCFADPGGRNRSLLVSSGWPLMKPCSQSLAHGVLGCPSRHVISMSV